MAARDVQMNRSLRPVRYPVDMGTSERGPGLGGSQPGGGASDGRAPILTFVLRRRWPWIFLLSLLSCVAGLFAAMQWSNKSATTQGALLYTGLPGRPGPNVYEPLGPRTCSELLTSISVLNDVLSKRGLDMPPTQLAEFITVTLQPNSSLMNIELKWSEAESAASVLNDLMQVFIDHVVTRRRQTLSDHINHVETALMQARLEVDEARQDITDLRMQQEQQLEEGGLNSEQYRSALESASRTLLSIDDMEVQEMGIAQQIDALKSRQAAMEQELLESETSIKNELLEEVRTHFERFRSDDAPGSTSYEFFGQLLVKLEEFAKSPDAPAHLDRWHRELIAKIAEGDHQLTPAETEELSTAFDSVLAQSQSTLIDLDAEIRALRTSQQKLQLDLIPVKNQIEKLKQRQADYKNQAEELGQEITGVNAEKFDEYEVRLADAQSKQSAILLQLDSMRKLESPRIKEWTVQLPASAETTEIRSNNKKIFVGTAVLLATLLTSPFFLAEWNARRTTPQLEFARALRLPVIAEQIVQDLRPSRRGQVDLQQFNENQLESLRMLTLRIQQSAHRSGSVMVFSSLDSDASAAPLMAAVAQCLAQREERVLLIDAVSPDKSSHPILNLFPIPIDAATTQNAHSDRPGEYQNADAVDAANGRQPENQQSENERPQDVRPDVEQSKAPSPRPDALVVAPGLAEFFSQTHPCEAHALIRPSACRGIDVITSGSTSFPREALASSALTALLEDCSRSYTIILVNGPPARWNADLEMLAARADGVVLTATPAIKNNFHARNVVQDLIELEAPIIGVVC